MDNKDILSPSPRKNKKHPRPDQVHLNGYLSARVRGNQQYLTEIYNQKHEWMLEPFRYRGQELKIEPLRNRPMESKWAGEYAGKWLDAASLVAANSQDETLINRTQQFAEEIMATQEADGYLGIEKTRERGIGWDVWNLWNALIGLLTQYEVFRDEASLLAAKNCGDWIINQFGMILDSDNPFFRSAHDDVCNGPIIDQFVRLYRFTKQKKYLDFASSVIRHYPYWDPMRNNHIAPLIHVYHLFGFLGGLVELVRLENQDEELHWIESVWDDLVNRHLYPTGSLGYREALRESVPNDTPVENGQPEKHHQETCSTVEWLFLNARLYEATGKMRYVEAMEHTIYNALLAAQSEDGLKWMYYTPLRYEKVWFSGPTSCCYWSGPRAIARLPEWIYTLDDEDICINFYESSEANLHLDSGAVRIVQSSHYPESGNVLFQIQPEMPFDFTIRFRTPYKASDIHVELNAQILPVKIEAGGYFEVKRKWFPGDQIHLVFDIPVYVEHFLSDQYGILFRGTEVLVVDQQDNASLNLDQINLHEEMVIESIDPENNRRRYLGRVYIDDRLVEAIFTTYAGCGENSRFRTAFPIKPGKPDPDY